MLRCSLKFVVIGFMFSVVNFAQAQHQLARPRNLRIENDALIWDAVNAASGYRIRWLGRNDWITAEAAQNSFSLSGFRHGSTHLIQVKAISSDATAYQDSYWSLTFVLRRPFPTATPTNTPTDTPTPTPTRVVLREACARHKTCATLRTVRSLGMQFSGQSVTR